MNQLSKNIFFSFLVFSLMLVLGLAKKVHAQDLNVSTVSSIWPYPSQILKVHSAPADIKRSGQSLRMADIIAQSKTTNQCVAYTATFKRGGAGWEFNDIESQVHVACQSQTGKNSSYTKQNNYYSEPSAGGSSDPREPLEDGLGEVNRTVGDVEDVHQTIQRVKNIKKLF